MSEKIFLGAIALEQGEAIALDLPADLDPEAVKALIEKANASRAEKQVQESRELRRLFLDNTKAEK